ncbi:virulence factor SrfC family protein [Candidatus Riflebacteria bacterium]
MEVEKLREHEKKVIEMTGKFGGLLKKGLSWSESFNKETVKKRLFHLITKIKRIEESARRPIALGIFGASQCGKSYLVSELVRGPTENLRIFLNDSGQSPALFNYLEEINPVGGRESTALVTRFTRRPYIDIDGCAASIRFISRVDLIKIFINGFSFECETGFKLSHDFMNRIKAGYRGKRGSGTTVFSEEEITELQEYVNRHFRRRVPYNELEEFDFWNQWKSVVNYFPMHEQLAFIEILWGACEPLTALYKKLNAQLSQENGDLSNRVAGIYKDALMPRDGSIIDVQRIFKWDESREKLELKTIDGKTVQMAANYLCALTREILLTVPPDVDNDLIDRMDVLDFPGARAREKQFNEERLKNDPQSLYRVFLRGKVAYLFDRACDDLDINGLILCQEGGNQEAGSLPFMINKWVEWSHGRTPEERDGKKITLFHAFTKFDEDLVYKQGDRKSLTTRWNTRLKTHFEEFFSREGDWVREWSPDRPFDNCFWVRNPGVRSGVFHIRDGREELSYPHDFEKIHQGYCNSPIVKTYFKDPTTAWQKAASPNNPGIHFLRDSILEVVAPDLKVLQLDNNLQRFYRDFRTLLENFYVGDNTLASIKKAEKRANRLLGHLMKVMRTHYALPKILDRDRFSISEKLVATLYDQVVNPMFDTDILEDEEEVVEASTPLFDDDPFAIDGLELEEDTAARDDSKSEACELKPVNKGELFARSVLSHWFEQLQGLATEEELLRQTGLEPDWFAELALEFEKGADRLNFFETIANNSNAHLNAPHASRFMRWQATSTSSLLNHFVINLGRERQGKKLPEGPPQATLSTKSYPGATIYKHWTHSMRELFKENVTAGAQVDAESNRLLKEILSQSLK